MLVPPTSTPTISTDLSIRSTVELWFVAGSNPLVVGRRIVTAPGRQPCTADSPRPSRQGIDRRRQAPGQAGRCPRHDPCSSACSHEAPAPCTRRRSVTTSPVLKAGGTVSSRRARPTATTGRRGTWKTWPTSAGTPTCRRDLTPRPTGPRGGESLIGVGQAAHGCQLSMRLYCSAAWLVFGLSPPAPLAVITSWWPLRVHAPR